MTIRERPSLGSSEIPTSLYSCQDFALRSTSIRWDELVEMGCPVTHIGEGSAMPPVLTLGVRL